MPANRKYPMRRKSRAVPLIETTELTAPPKVHLTPEDIQRMEDAATRLQDKLLVRLLRREAGRVSEVIGIEEKNINFSLRQIKIVHQKARITRFCPYCYSEDVKTRLSKKWRACPICQNPVPAALTREMEETELRKIPVDKDTLELIRKHIKGGGVKEVRDYVKKDGVKVLRVRRLLFPITRQWAWRIIVELGERAGIFELENPKNEHKHHVHPHNFRDAFVSNIMDKNPNDDEVRLLQEMLGHKNFNTTAAYRKVSGAELRAQYDKWIEEESHGR